MVDGQTQISKTSMNHQNHLPAKFLTSAMNFLSTSESRLSLCQTMTTDVSNALIQFNSTTCPFWISFWTDFFKSNAFGLYLS